MRIRFVGDHSALHCGCQAVVQVFRERYGAHRWVSEGEDHDALIVNGEGTMHHASPGYHLKMQCLVEAVRQGKPAFLLNSLWQDNDHAYDAVLGRLDAIQVRERLSAQDIRAHGVQPEIVPDLSWFAPIDESEPAPDWSGKVVMTDFYLPDTFGWGVPAHLADVLYVDMAHHSWSAFVKGLRTVRLLITGRHHAVYAACKASVPFVPVSSNSHKIEGLMASAEVDIASFRDPPTLDEALRYADDRATAYAGLFDWLGGRDLRLPRL